MAARKTAMLTLRIEAEIQPALWRAAELTCDSIAHMVEGLIRKHYWVTGIATGDTSNNRRGTKGVTL